jgi:hypothetical protein
MIKPFMNPKAALCQQNEQRRCRLPVSGELSLKCGASVTAATKIACYDPSLL